MEAIKAMFLSIQQQQNKFEQQSTVILQDLWKKMELLELQSNQTQATTLSQQNFAMLNESTFSFNPDNLAKGIKLELPKISRDGVKNWIFTTDQFFNFYKVKDSQRLIISLFAFEGDVVEWYKWMYLNNHLKTQSAFLKALEARIRPLEYDGPSGTLFKLTYKGTVV